jgi:hypothetical protein
VDSFGVFHFSGLFKSESSITGRSKAARAGAGDVGLGCLSRNYQLEGRYRRQLLDQVVEVGVENRDPLSIRRGRPIHVPDDVSWHSNLLDASNPGVNIWNEGSEQVRVGCDDRIQVG